jgi:hypothetical protein
MAVEPLPKVVREAQAVEVFLPATQALPERPVWQGIVEPIAEMVMPVVRDPMVWARLDLEPAVLPAVELKTPGPAAQAALLEPEVVARV